MKPITILFPHEPFTPSTIDSEFAAEFEAAKLIGFPCEFYDYESLAKGEIGAAFDQLPEVQDARETIFRGWMMNGETYAAAFDELRKKGYAPRISPNAYEEAHYLPFAYQHTEGESPRSSWIEGDDVDGAWNLYQSFNQNDAIIKDWVKSAKSRWKEGCFIPAGTNEEEFREIYRVFREERSKLFNRGVVIREFIPIVEKGSSIHGLPLIEETRLFFWNGEILVRPKVASPSPMDELPRWEAIARKFQSTFLTIDVALLEDGTWKVVEVGDGGVSGLPMGLEPEIFFAAIWNAQSTGES